MVGRQVLWEGCSEVEGEPCSLCADAIEVCGEGKLAEKGIGLFLFQAPRKLEFYGHPLLVIAEVPDAFSQDGIDNGPDVVLGVPDGVEVSHGILWLAHR